MSNHMQLIKIILLLLLPFFLIGSNADEETSRGKCVSIDFNDPTKIPPSQKWPRYGGIGPVIAIGMDRSEAKSMLNNAFRKISPIDGDHQYKLVSIQNANRCTLKNNIREFDVTLIDKNSQSKQCFIQIYKNYEQTSSERFEAIVIACSGEEQYFQTYAEE